MGTLKTLICLSIFILCAMTLQAGTAHALGSGIECRVPESPQIKITPITDDIKYNYHRSMAELTAMKSDSKNPYGPNVDTATGGLRVDHPEMSINVKLGLAEYPARDQFCMWYNSIEVIIHLKPEVFVADELNYHPCRGAVLNHEHKHVEIDRQIADQYAGRIGDMIKGVVNDTGAVGPYPEGRKTQMQQQLMQKVRDAISSQEDLLHREMERRQGMVDTLKEYERVSSYCKRPVSFPPK